MRTQILRFLWCIVYWSIFFLSPHPLYRWRAFILRIFGADLAAGVRIYPTARIFAPWNLAMGKNSCLSWGVDCYCVAKIIIGDNVVVSQGAFLCTGTHDIRSAGMELIALPIVIGDSSWVCARAYVGPGVSLGDGCVIAACAVVSKSSESWLILAGNPAKVIGRRKIRTHNGSIE